MNQMYNEGKITHTNSGPKSPAPTSRRVEPEKEHEDYCAICGKPVISIYVKTTKDGLIAGHKNCLKSVSGPTYDTTGKRLENE